MSTTLQQHGRSITGGFATVVHRQGVDCGELVSTADETEPDDGAESDDGASLSRREQIGLVLAVLVLLVGGGVAVGGL